MNQKRKKQLPQWQAAAWNTSPALLSYKKALLFRSAFFLSQDSVQGFF
jgi:hypothetical protein